SPLAPRISPSSRPSPLLPAAISLPTSKTAASTTSKAPAGAPATSAAAASSSTGSPILPPPRRGAQQTGGALLQRRRLQPHRLRPFVSKIHAASNHTRGPRRPATRPPLGIQAPARSQYRRRRQRRPALQGDMHSKSCFYWTEPWGWSNHLMVLDTRTMSFSTVNLLTGHHKELRDNLAHQSLGHRRPNAVVLGREGAIEMVSLVRRHGSFALHHTSLQNNSHEWKLEKIVQLPGQYRDYSISMVGAAEGFLFFRAAPQQGIPIQNVDCYSMEVKTYEITKVCTKTERFLDRKRALPYFSFPPVLSEPTI
uniref:Uncharacterized protein n=1 Tax=Aegilops tauschii subsp. strangulata TaxID=200361 RepID=A0A453QGV6_AEGTS